MEPPKKKPRPEPTENAIKIRQEPEDTQKTYINRSKQDELIDYFHNTDTDADRRRLKNNEIKITLHTEGLLPTEIAQIARKMNAKQLCRQSKNKRYTHAIINIDNTTLNRKLDVPAKNRLNQEPNNLFENADIELTADQSTQVNTGEIEKEYRDIETNTQLQIGEEELRDLTHPELEPLPILKQLNNIPNITNPTMKFPDNTLFNERTFINYTDHMIPKNIAYMLGMGPKFAAPLNAENDTKLFEKIETITLELHKAHVEPTDLSDTVQHIKNCIEAYKKHDQRFSMELKAFYDQSMTDTIEFFKQNKNLIATQTDKSKAAVLIYKQDYIDKMIVHLSDTTTYSKIKYSSLEGYKVLNERYLEILTEKKYITPYKKEKAIRDETKISNIYGLIKDHKPDKKIRPICNTRNTPGYLLAKTLSDILTNALKTGQYDIKNSVELNQRLKDGEYTPSMILASLDVVSMFTNITFDQVVKSIQKRYTKKTIKTKLPLNHMISMLQFVCCFNTELQFNNIKYKQIKGLRMGSPVSPILAQIVMDDILDEAFSQIEKPQIFMKYVDDILTIARPEDLDKITTKLNQINPDIQFELEIESPTTKSINFLELTIINHHDTTISSKWYQKEVSSMRILNYHSQHIPFQIRATAKSYVNNMIQLTDKEYLEETIIKARKILLLNNFPHRFIHTIITETRMKHYPETQATEETSMNQSTEETTTNQTIETPNENERNTFYAKQAMPYVMNLSQKLTAPIKTKNPGIMIPSSTINTIQQKIYNKHKNLNKKQQNNTENDSHLPI